MPHRDPNVELRIKINAKVSKATFSLHIIEPLTLWLSGEICLKKGCHRIVICINIPVLC